MTKAKSLIAAIAVLAFSGMHQAHADVLQGPSLTSKDSGHYFTGLGFTANTDATLTSFVFQNQGQADTVYLYDYVGNTFNVLDSIAVSASTSSFDAVVNWSLTTGVQYYLLQSTLSNALYASWGTSPVSDAELTLTDSGVFSRNSSLTSPSDFSLSGFDYWAAFNDITTVAVSPVPEPQTYALLLAGLALLGWHTRRRRFQKVSYSPS